MSNKPEKITNVALAINYIYTDESYSQGDPLKKGYVVVYNPTTELGKIIDNNVMENNLYTEEQRLKELDTHLTEAFDLTDEGVVFYYGVGEEIDPNKFSTSKLAAELLNEDIRILSIDNRYMKTEEQ